jgi:di/tricarboxylate transporter
MVVLLATGVVPAAVAALLAACALVLTRTVSVTQAFHAVSWTTVVLIAGMIPLSTAFLQTGTADLVAGWLLTVLGDAGPHIALLMLCVLTVTLGQLISNTATVLIIAPIAISVAAALDLSVQPFMMALTVAGAAAFLTPIATPANLMVMEPAGYRFGDYWKLGLPMAVFFVLVATFYVPLIWPF